MDKKRGQLEISFGTIFSIILIIAFLGAAFYAIQKFLSFQSELQTQKFYDSLRTDVNSVWTSNEASKQTEYVLPSSVKQVCFRNDNNDNVYFMENTPVPGQYVDHLNILTPYCVNASNGKVDFIIKKNYGEPLVSVTAATG
jgi:hypothetical protein